MPKETKNMTKKTIKPGKKIETSMVKGLNTQILSFIDQGVKEITIDFNGVEEIDSNGVGLLIGAHNSLKCCNGRLKIKNTTGRMQKLIRTMHLDKYFDAAA
jgi:anti-anti-sigma factor